MNKEKIVTKKISTNANSAKKNHRNRILLHHSNDTSVNRQNKNAIIGIFYNKTDIKDQRQPS